MHDQAPNGCQHHALPQLTAHTSPWVPQPCRCRCTQMDLVPVYRCGYIGSSHSHTRRWRVTPRRIPCSCRQRPRAAEAQSRQGPHARHGQSRNAPHHTPNGRPYWHHPARNPHATQNRCHNEVPVRTVGATFHGVGEGTGNGLSSRLPTSTGPIGGAKSQGGGQPPNAPRPTAPTSKGPCMHAHCN